MTHQDELLSTLCPTRKELRDLLPRGSLEPWISWISNGRFTKVISIDSYRLIIDNQLP